jgi:hypothetical protein
MKMDKLVAYEQSMEKNFRNYYDDNGYYEEDFDNFSFGQYGDNQFVNAVSGSSRVSRMNPNARIATIVITNTTSVDQTVTIFNPADGTTPTTSSIPVGCSVTLAQGSYSRLLTEILEKPFQIKGMKYAVKDVAQFDNVITLGYKNALGTQNQNVLTPYAYRSNLQNISTQIDIADFEYDVNIDSFVSVPVNGSGKVSGGERLTLTFYLKSQVQPSRVFYGQSDLARSKEGFITGLPQQQIVIKNPAPASSMPQRRMA